MTSLFKELKRRPYQLKSIDLVRLAFRRGARCVLGIAPTGAGKSLIFHDFAASILSSKSCLILTDRIELLLQASTLCGGRENVKVQTVQKFWIDYKKGTSYPDFIIIDEAHSGLFSKVIEERPEKTLIFGLTATPVCAKKGDVLANYYQEMIEFTNITECLREGWLVPCVTYRPKYAINKDSLKIKVGEYTDDSQISELSKLNVENDIKSVISGIKGKVLVFCVNIAHAKNTQTLLNANFCVHSEMDIKERRLQIDTFKASKTSCIMVNCGILTTGFDCPEITDIVILRKTKSLPLYFQICGRGSRLAPNKKIFRIWDFGLNYEEHGLWSDPVDWFHLFKHGTKNPRTTVAPSKNCKNCGAIIPVQARICSYCGEVLPIKPAKKEDASIEEMSVVKPIDYDFLYELKKVHKGKGKHQNWAYHKIKSFASKEAIPLKKILDVYAEIVGYTQNWWVSCEKYCNQIKR